MEPLKDLFAGIANVAIYGDAAASISSITTNSRQARPGALYIAKKGKTFDGKQFIAEAAKAGAKAVLADTYDPALSSLVQVVHPDPCLIEESIVSRLYHNPASKLHLIGITGTNGKTTTSYIAQHLLQPHCGLIGTIQWNDGVHSHPSAHTTPDFCTLNHLFHAMVQNSCRFVSMEVSSHALSQGRVKNLAFHTAVFTNLTQDHLDYHKTMEEYAAAKAKLFTGLEKEAFAVVNCDDPWSEIMLQNCPAKKLFFGFSSSAHLQASDVLLTAAGMRFTLAYEGQHYTVESPLIGRFNVYNILAALASGLSCGLSLSAMLEKLRSFTGAPGRLQRVLRSDGRHVFVDYAHTDDALKNVLETLHELKQRKIITVFGCGGDRDRAKRPKMGAAASAMSDFVIVTSDNPRSEEPSDIARQILPGIVDPSRCFVELDRARAIQKAVAMAEEGDIVLIAGKGHEKTQIFKDKMLPFDDVDCAQSKF